jgi:seryl-tRNA synthetase
VLDLAALKTPPGDYTIAFLGGVVAKYRHQPETVKSVEAASKKMALEVKALEAELKKVTSEAETAPAEKKEKAIKTVGVMNAKMKAATVALNATNEQLKKATEAAQPRDIADIVVTEPITIRIKPAEKK